jgi:hypothetical protein
MQDFAATCETGDLLVHQGKRNLAAAFRAERQNDAPDSSSQIPLGRHKDFRAIFA